MRKLLILAVLFTPTAFGYASFSGFCEQGGVKVSVAGQTSPLTFMQSYPNLAQSAAGPHVTVYLTGTTTKPTNIYSDNAGTILVNPFPCTATGQYLFFASEGTYDLLFSGTGITPFTRGSIQGVDPSSVPFVINYLPASAGGASLSSQCAAAVTAGAMLVFWQNAAATPTTSCAANTWFLTGGKITMSSSAVLTFASGSTVTAPPAQQIFDTSASGSIVRFTSGVAAASWPNWFGALGNNSHDDYAAFQAAITATETTDPTPSSTAPVLILPGTYRINTGLVSTAWGASIKGVGSTYASTTISYAGSSGGIALSMRGFHATFGNFAITPRAGASGWLSGLNYEGSQSTLDNIFISCDGQAGDAFTASREGVAQSDQLIASGLTTSNCPGGIGIQNFQPNSLSLTFNNARSYSNKVGMKSFTTTNMSFYGGEFDHNDVNFWPGIGAPTVISGVRAENSKRSMHSTAGAAAQPVTFEGYDVSNVNDVRPGTTTTASASACTITLSVAGFTYDDYVTIAGAGVASAALPVQITDMPTLTTATINPCIVTSVTGAAVTMTAISTSAPQDQFVMGQGGPYTFIGTQFNNSWVSGATVPQTISANTRASFVFNGNTWGGLGKLTNGPFGNSLLDTNTTMAGNQVDHDAQFGGPYHFFSWTGATSLITVPSVTCVSPNTLVTPTLPTTLTGSLLPPIAEGSRIIVYLGACTLATGTGDSITYKGVNYAIRSHFTGGTLTTGYSAGVWFQGIYRNTEILDTSQ